MIANKDLTQVYSIGINGGARGQEDCLCKTSGKYGCIHAEINALIKCRNDDNSKIMFCTLAPCKACAAAIINAPGAFDFVFYIIPWKETEGVDMLRNAGIAVSQI